MPMSVQEADLWTPTPLQIHHGQCSFSSGMLHRLRCASEAISAFMGARIVSTLCVAFVVTSVIVSMNFGTR